jgi:uncharacterized phage-like protein YoqJ
MSNNPFVKDLTRYDTFRKEKYGPLEFAMHKVWRSSAQMFDLASGKHPWPTMDQIIQRLNQSIEELQQSRDLLMEKTSDRVEFYDEKEKKMSFFKEPPTAFKTEEN